MPQTEQVAHRLATIQAAREVVPSDPNHSARWHRHGVPSPFSRWNHHPEYEVHLITAGTGWYVVGDCIDVFSAGQLVLVGSHVPHHWISDLAPGERLPERDVVFQFHPQWIDRCADLLPEVGAARALLRQSRRGIEFSGPTRDAAAERLQAIGVTEGAARLGHIFGLLGLLSDAPDGERRYLAAEWSTSLDEEGTGAADRVDLAFGYIFAHLGDADLRLADTARHVGMSESAFSRYFARVTGVTFADTVRRLRLAQAGKLLRGTTLPVAAIAHRVGYANLSNFNRQFRAHHGHTPRTHRG
ncbi:AraC family transcriptional regulator [Microlunatus aurantiacus]|uniref:AraC family transcriptional regulator n=1 Tax=Microlunatus aurantiacus TaxID=446786 RepID=A0ABP7EFS2_9ACTN